MKLRVARQRTPLRTCFALLSTSPRPQPPSVFSSPGATRGPEASHRPSVRRGCADCSGDGDETPRDWRLGASYGYVSTRLKLRPRDHRGRGLHETGGDFVARTSPGRPLDGRCCCWVDPCRVAQAPEGTFDLSPGPLLTLTGSFRALDEGTVAPFLLLTASLGGAVAWTTPSGAAQPGGAEAFWAFDGRLGVAAGKTIAHAITPYVLARGFGLPVLWHEQGESTVGTDAYHYQVGAGVVARLGRSTSRWKAYLSGRRRSWSGVGSAL